MNASGGAGVQAAQFISQHGAQGTISGDFGPKACSAQAAAGVGTFMAPAAEGLTAHELLARPQAGQLKQVSALSNSGHHTLRDRGWGSR